MKKLASAATAILLGVIMALSCLVTVSAVDETVVDTSKKGSITLTKYDGKKEDNKPVKDATFSAYRILDFDGKTYTVNTNFTGQVVVDDIVNTSASQAGTLSYGSTTELEAQITKLQNHIKTSNVAATQSGATADNGKVTLSDLPLGVYLVQETVVPAGYTVTTQAFLVALPTWDQASDTWVYAIEATPKDELLQVDKQMKDTNPNTADGTKNDSYSIGDTIPYVVTVKIPNYGNSSDEPSISATDNLLYQNLDIDGTTVTAAGITKYNALNLQFTDTLSKGLTLDLSSLEIKVLNTHETDPKDTTLQKGDELKELVSATKSSTDNTFTKTPKTAPTTEGNTVGDYTAELTDVADGATQMTINIAWATLDDYQGKTIQLTYSAQLNNEAVAGTANTNTVGYKFSNDPQKATGEVDDPSKTITTDTDNVYTYEMDLTKTFNGAAADGTTINASTVEFELYVKNTDGGDVAEANQKLSFIKNSDGNYTVWTEESPDETVVTTLNPDSEGHLYVKGLEAGTYELKETKSLDGYTILTEPVTILVEEVKEGEPAVVTQKVSAYTLAFVSEDSGGNITTTNKDSLTPTGYGDNGKFAITVNNAKSQFNLPITGGLGLWMFTIGGGVVMAGAIIFFSVIRKKKSKS